MNNYWITTCDSNGMVKQWNIETGLLYEWDYLRNIIALSPDRLRIAAFDDKIQLYEFTTHQLLHTFYDNISRNATAHEDTYYTCGAFSHGNVKIVSGNNTGDITIWDLNTDVFIKYRGHKEITSIAFSHNDLCIISIGHGNHAKIWDVNTGMLRTNLSDHASRFITATFSMDDRQIITVSEDGTIKMWDTCTGQLLTTLHAHTKSIYHVAISSDNLKIVSCGQDGVVQIWDMVTSNSYMNCMVTHMMFYMRYFRLIILE